MNYLLHMGRDVSLCGEIWRAPQPHSVGCMLVQGTDTPWDFLGKCLVGAGGAILEINTTYPKPMVSLGSYLWVEVILHGFPNCLFVLIFSHGYMLFYHTTLIVLPG